MYKEMDPRVVHAITHAVHAAIAAVGMEGLKRTSMFPSATAKAELKLAA